MADYSEANADGKRSIVDSQLREKEISDSFSGLMPAKKSESSCSKKIDIIASNLSRSDSGFLDSEFDSQKIDPGIRNTDTAVKNLSDAFLAKKPVEDLHKKLKEQIKNSENLQSVISELTESSRKSLKYSEKDGKVGTKKAETAIEFDPAYKRFNDDMETHDKTIYEGKLIKLQTKIISEKLGLDSKKAEDLAKVKKGVDINSTKNVGKQKEVDINKKSEQSPKLTKLLENVDEINDFNISPDSSVSETFEKDETISLNNETVCQINDVKEDKSQNKKNKDFGNNEDKISGTKKDLNNSSENVETISKNIIEISERSKIKLDSRTESKKRVDCGKNKEKNSGNKKSTETDKLDSNADEHNGKSKSDDSKIDTSDKRIKDILDCGKTEADKSQKLVIDEKIRERNIEKHKEETNPVKSLKGKKSQNETKVIGDSDERKKETNNEKMNENKTSERIEKDNEKTCKFKKDISPKKNERNKTEVKKEMDDLVELATKDGKKSEVKDKKVELGKKDKEIDNIEENEKKDNAEESRTKDTTENKINEDEPKSLVENVKKKYINEKKDKEIEKKGKMDEKKDKTEDYLEPPNHSSPEEIINQIDKTIENNEVDKEDDKEKNEIGNASGRKSSERIKGRETPKGRKIKEPKKSPNKKEATPKYVERLGVELRPRRKPEIKTPEIKPPPPPKQSRQRNVTEEKKVTPKGSDVEKNKSQGTAKKVSTISDSKNEGTSDLDTEMKGYAADAMNELLGLYGYDKVDETEKNSLNLSNSLLKTTPATTAVPTKKQLVQQPAPLPPATTTSNSTSTTTTSSSTPSSTGSSSNADKSIQKQHPCIVCRQIKKCKYNIVRNGDVRYLCEDECFQKFRAKPTDYLQVIDSGPRKCHVCQNDISMPGGMLPLPGDPTKPVCSEQCSKNYQMQQGPQKVCAQCKFAIQSGKKFLSWETMEFCCEECLGKYQTGLGVHCNFCHVEIQRTSLGKHCIKVGSEIKQFCTSNCQDEFRKGLKVCNYCQKDLSNNPEGFLAPVGDKGEFKDFCSQACMEKYDSKLKDRNNWNSGSKETCSVCKKTGPIKNEVAYEGTKYYLCSDPCVSSFSFSNNLTVGTCDNCGVFCYNDKSQPFFIQFEGKTKRFCSNMCVSAFRLTHSKIVSCTWCKSKKFNFDMIERVDANNKYQHFCSLNCLSLYRVSLNATSSRSVPCDCCKQVVPAQYHLTMSDASVRNFCSYSCVVQFQNQFTGVTPIITRIQSQQQNSITTIASQGKSSQPSPTPVISSVVSLAPMNQQQTTQPQTTPTGKRQVQNKPTPAFTPKQNAVTPVQRRVTTTTTTTNTNNTRSSGPPPVTNNTTSRVRATQPLQPATTHVSTATPSPTIQQQVIVQHPPPKQLKNKALLCKPFMQTKATYCRPHTACKITQTEDYMGKPILIPVPVPVYVPIPMHMYTVPIPFPMAIPIPIPVPCFIPTTKNSAESILRHIKEIQDKIPTDPFEAELLMMAEMVASGDTHTAESKDSSEAGETEPAADHTGADFQMDSQDPLHATNVLGDDMLQMALRMASEMTGPAVDLETALAPDANSQAQINDEKIKSPIGNYLLAKSDFGVLDESRDMVSPRDLRARQRSQKRTSSGRGGRRGKRARIEEPIRINSSPVLLTADANMCLKYTYGVNAWKHWVLQKNSALEKASQRSGKLKLFKTDLLQLTADELNYSLCLFVKEVRKPNGEEYAPDSIYYLCLGIQQYLFENCRIDNIFTDIYYEKFTECLNEIVQRYEVRLNEAGILVCRIEEEILWESKQLGAHSPHVLLNSLLYFNTKYFMLKTSEDHQRLSFSHVLKQWRKSTGGSKNNSGRTMYLRYCPPINEIKKGKRDELAVFEQQENVDNPLRCPVKLYEFYLSKCPESIKNRNDVFYLVPERSCVPDSPVWYSTQPLGKEALSKMLHRIQMVREVNEAHMQQMA